MAARVPRLHTKERLPNGEKFLKLAVHYNHQRSYPKALENFIKYFETLNDPSKAHANVKMAFTRLVWEIGNVLEYNNDIEELLKLYLQAINLFPDNYVILTNLGSYMFKIGELDIARKYLEEAVKAQKDYLPADRNLMHVKWHQVSRWHFRMLNDKVRNSAYYYAINETTSAGYTEVLDIGGGCGLLSFFAAKNPNANVTIIEENKALYKVCENIVKENEMQNITMLNINSTELSGGLDNCNLIVTEIFDVALFGERALETLSHAINTFPASNDFKVIPASADIYVCGIACPEIAKKYKTLIKLPFLKSEINLKTECESYEAECLNDFNVDYLTEPLRFYSVNFSNKAQLATLIENKFKETLTLNCIKSGVMDCLVVWFDLKLTDNYSITTNPLKEDCANCWEQAVFPFKQSVMVNGGDSLKIDASLVDSELKLARMDENLCCVEASSNALSLLRDEKLVKTISLLSKQFNDKSKKFMDLSPFPLVGISLARRGFTVVYIVRDRADAAFTTFLLNKLNIPSKSFLMIPEVVTQPRLDHSVYSKLKVDTVFVDPIAPDGSLNKWLFAPTELTLAKTETIPTGLYLYTQLIYSDYIDYCNRVDDDNCFNFNIAKHMNTFTGQEHPNLDKFPFKKMSHGFPFDLAKQVCDKLRNFEVLENGVINGIYCWYMIHYYNNIHFSTLDSSHFRKTCFLLEEPKTVSKGDVVKVVVRRKENFLKVLVL